MELTDLQMLIVERYGRLRNDANKGRRDNRAPGTNAEKIHQLGVGGEYALFLATGIPWTGRYFSPATLKRKKRAGEPIPDLGTDIEVRTRTSRWHQLLVHRNDPKAWRYVLVRYTAPNQFDLIGWEFGVEIKQSEYWKKDLPYPAFAYPNKLLRPIGEL